MGATITRVDVDLGTRSYPILISEQLFSCPEARQTLTQSIRGSRVCVITNETIAPLYLDNICSLLQDFQVDRIVLPDGEQYKNLQSIDQIMTGLLEQKQNRSVTLIALGGGVIGDMTGFASACYQRGVDFIQIPTTLLAQVDSSVGGKTGVNHPLGKNMIGAFKQPNAVLIDTQVLQTLPDREYAAGMAEVIKYGLIWDASFFDWLEAQKTPLKNRQGDALIQAIARSCEIKADVVSQDETEQGVRAILNLGHTFGHAIETFTGYYRWLHGEAVAVGMLMALDLSARLHPKTVTVNAFERLKALQASFGLPLTPPEEMKPEDFLSHMALDKKNITGSIRLILVNPPGQAYIADDYGSDKLMETLQEFCV